MVRPVVAVDIDGTLGEYHEHFRRFASEYYGRHLPIGYDGSTDFSSWLGLSKAEYRQAKLAYRQGGAKRTMPVRDGAVELVNSLREQGAEIWLCTTRPYLRLDNIDPDTREWLRRHGIPYDGLLYGEDKYARLLECVDFERVVGVYDDLYEMCEHAAHQGFFAIQAISKSNSSPRASWEVRADTVRAHLALQNIIEEWWKENGR